MFTGYSQSQLRDGNVGRNASGGKLEPPEKPGERELELELELEHQRRQWGQGVARSGGRSRVTARSLQGLTSTDILRCEPRPPGGQPHPGINTERRQRLPRINILWCQDSQPQSCPVL